MNHFLLCIGGKSASGKTASLEHLRDHKGVFYANCENGKEIPFKNEFKEKIITDPLELPIMLTKMQANAKMHTAVIDTLTYLMERYESTYINKAQNKMAAWGAYGDYFRDLMNDNVAQMDKNVVFLGHTTDVKDENTGASEVMIKVKGALMATGIESRFTNVISTKKVPISMLEGYENDLLTITDDEREDEFKYVYQTRLTKDTFNERIRSPMGLWKRNETYIDNNVQNVLDRLHEYYKK